MNRVLNRRILRDLRANIGRYIALMLMIILGIYLVVSIVGSAEMVIQGTDNAKSENLVEDGEFTMFQPLTGEELEMLSKRGTVIEKMFSFDKALEDGSEVRIFAVREHVNRVVLDEGAMPQNTGSKGMAEAVIEKNYARVHEIKHGDTIRVGDRDIAIVGIGSVPDYDAALKTFSSQAVDAENFGLLFVTAEAYEEILAAEQKTEDYTYAFRLGDESFEELKEKIKNTGVLTGFIKADENQRIAAAAGDVVMDQKVGLVAGVIILILFAYVISVFVVHQIEREQSVIGALYSMGVKRNDLLRHYVKLPTILAFLAGCIGCVLAFSPIGVDVRVENTYSYFSIPGFDKVYPLYLIIYAVVLPPVICLIVNILTIKGKLSQTALSLLRNEQNYGKQKMFNLKIKSFTRLFAVRQLLRESRSAIILLMGMLITMAVLILGINTYVLCSHVRDGNIEDTHYQYMYLLKYPAETLPTQAEATYVKSLSIDCEGYSLEVSVIGIDRESRYFSDVHPEKGKSKAVVNVSLAQRFGYKTGDKITLEDSAMDQYYTFNVTDVSDYSVGFAIFMDIDSMRELFGEEAGYINVLYSDEPLEIDEARLYSMTTKAEIEHSSAVFLDMMFPLTVTLISAGSIICCVVMYLMMAVTIDRSAMGISLIKIFGYRSNEVRKLYLNGNTAIVAIGGLFVIPLAKFLIDTIYPSFIANVACSMDLHYPWMLYLGVYLFLLCIYFTVNALLLRKINRITPAEVLKDRE